MKTSSKMPIENKDEILSLEVTHFI